MVLMWGLFLRIAGTSHVPRATAEMRSGTMRIQMNFSAKTWPRKWTLDSGKRVKVIHQMIMDIDIIA
jgi:hypothetical protein